MDNQQPPEQKNNMKRFLPYLLVGVFSIVALVSLYFTYRASTKTKAIPPDYKKVVAVTGTDIPVSVQSDGVSIYFEHNGERLSLTNRITDLMVGTEYTFTFTNNSGVKQGVFIPALKESVVTETTQPVSISIRFDNPGTYYFMGNVYQPGWDGLKSGLDVGMDTIEPPPITASAGTATPTPTSTASPTPTATPTGPPNTSFSCSNVTEIPQIECEALVALYNSTNGPGWTPHPGWLQTITPCGWYGLGCSPENPQPRHIVQINLQQSNMVGQIPESIGNLTQLQSLTLLSNQLTGSIPTSISNLTNLWNLNLVNNILTGIIPENIGNLTQLTSLHLSNNRLTGNIPASIGNLSRLTALSLTNNQFSGNIPAVIGNLSNLRGLGLDFNLLTGNIPTNIGNLTQLGTLHLAGNQLTGTVPASLANLTAISGMNFTLNTNSITGVENQSVCSWLTVHTQSNWWQLQNPPISSDPCGNINIAQPVRARTNPSTSPLPSVTSSNILERITLFFQQLLQNVFRTK